MILYWPVKIDESIIALRSKAAGRFCHCYFGARDIYWLGTSPTTITREERLSVEALVMGSRIYDVDNARVYDLTPFVAGTTTLTNDGDQVAAIEYEDSKESTFNRSASLTLGVTISFKTGFPTLQRERLRSLRR